MEYPKYVSHKEVAAARISKVDLRMDGGVSLELEDGFDAVNYSGQEMKHKPMPETGGYLIRYADGYISFSPAKQFEEGYTVMPSAGPKDDDEDEDEEVRDAKNNHGQGAAMEEHEPVAV